MRIGFAAGTAMALLLAACGGSEEGGAEKALEKGQVVATVNGKDITVHELNAELQGVNLPSGEQRKAVEQAALQQVINRHILADLARERGLDDSPTYILQRRRAEEGLLVELLRRDLAQKQQPPSRDEAERFIAENPQLFAERKIYAIDQIQFPQPQNIAELREFEPLTTMEQVESKLIEDGVRYRRAPTQLDALATNPDLIAQMNKLPAGEIFLIPTGQVVLANQITGAKPEPVPTDQAIAIATRMLQQRQLMEAANKELEPLLKKARDSVQYQEGYAPPKAPAAPAGGTAPKAQPAG